MVAARTHFDGEKIEVPAELRGRPAGEVLVIFSEAEGGNAGARKTSIWDACGKARMLRTGEDIDAQVREEREAWGER